MRRVLVGIVILVAAVAQPITAASAHPNTNDYYGHVWNAEPVHSWSWMRPTDFWRDFPYWMPGDETIIQPTTAQKGAIERAFQTMNSRSYLAFGSWASSQVNSARSRCSQSKKGHNAVGIGDIDGKGTSYTDSKGQTVTVNRLAFASTCTDYNPTTGKKLLDSQGRVMLSHFSIFIDKAEIGEWHTGTSTDSGGKLDLESIVLHEVLHATGRLTGEVDGHWRADNSLCRQAVPEVLCPVAQLNTQGRKMTTHDDHLLVQAYPFTAGV